MLSLEQVRALEDRVEKAVSYIAALRAENSELERRLSEDQSLIDGAVAEAEARAAAGQARISEAEAKASEALAARDAALSRVREFEARVSDMAERVAAAEARAAEIGAKADEYRKDQARIEEGIIHALEKLDSFEDLVLSRPAEPEPEPEKSEQVPEADIDRTEETSGIAVKTPPKAGEAGQGASGASTSAGELDIF